jgi:hypothetical protein
MRQLFSPTNPGPYRCWMDADCGQDKLVLSLANQSVASGPALCPVSERDLDLMSSLRYEREEALSGLRQESACLGTRKPLNDVSATGNRDKRHSR